MTVAAPVTVAVGKCGNCGAPFPPASHVCASCFQSVGFPNVRECEASAEIEALQTRYEDAKARATKAGAIAEFLALEAELVANSSVVISMPLDVAHSIISDPRNIYTGYETLVDAGVRLAAADSNDRDRRGVSGLLFGSYQAEVKYGVLSLADQGLPTYGDVFCRLKAEAIDKRTTFLEHNSFDFVKRHKLTVKKTRPPLGHRASWAGRHLLALAKLGHLLVPGMQLPQLQQLVVTTDNKRREKDDFIEAIIFGSLNVHSIQAIWLAPGRTFNRFQTTQLEATLDLFDRIKK